MDPDSLSHFLKRQRAVGKTLGEAQPRCLASQEEIRHDQKRLKAEGPAGIAAITQKYTTTRPRIVELKRMLSDCLFKLLALYHHGSEGLWYDIVSGSKLMERMWQEFGSQYVRPTREQLASYAAEYAKVPPPGPAAPTAGTRERPRLVAEVMLVAGQLRAVYDCSASPGSPAERDQAMNTTINEIWQAWHRERRHLVLPHTDSFDYFVQHGLQAVVRDMNHAGEFVRKTIAGGPTILAHIVPESLRLLPPSGTPQQARLAAATYCSRVVCKVFISISTAAGVEPLDFVDYITRQGPAEVAKTNTWLEQHGFVPPGSAAQATGLLWKDHEFPLTLGELPVMVGSSQCLLNGMTAQQRVALGEDEQEIGGFFVVNGNERIVRLMVHSRSNYPLAMQRATFARRGELLSDKAIVMRSTLPNGVYTANSVLYQSSGVALFSFARGRHWLIPLAHLLMALKPMTFQMLYSHFLSPERSEPDSDAAQASHDRAESNMRMAWEVARAATGDSGDAFDWTAFLGKYFQSTPSCQRWLPDMANRTPAYVGEYVIRRHVLPHLNAEGPLVPGSHGEEKERKFHCLVHMARKLFDFVDGHVGPDTADQTAHQQLVGPGDCLAALAQQNFHSLYRELEARIGKLRAVTEPVPDYTRGCDAMWRILSRMDRDTFGQVRTLIATGNFPAAMQRAFGVMQASGLSIVAERINMYRLLSQIRSVHRGSVVAEMRSSIARKLPLEAWGFLCPVETPDGAPCGVLNHLTAACIVTANQPAPQQVRKDVLAALEHRHMRPVTVCPPLEALRLASVTLDGELVGYLDPQQLDDTEEDNIGTWLRALKASAVAERLGLATLPATLEVCCIPFPAPTSEAKRQQLARKGMLPLYPGLVLYTTAGRLMRPVRSLVTGSVDYIGTLEQMYLHVACTGAHLNNLPRPEDQRLFRHMETSPGAVLSLVSSLIPFFAHNPSPRNLFQCQMAKQTMGTYSMACRQRFDNKVYELRTPQIPLVHTEQYWGWEMDSHPITTNAIVAIISYAEYDMEDAVVINKAALERGMFAGDVMKSSMVDLNHDAKRDTAGWSPATARAYGCFRRRPKPGQPGQPGDAAGADVDERGLPRKGAELRPGQDYYAYCEVQVMPNPDYKPGTTGKTSKQTIREYTNYKNGRYTKHDRCFVEEVLPAEVDAEGNVLAVLVRTRHVRDPVLGDKFSSQHGQKGTMSLMLPAVDMPFTDSGMVPDLLINPHAFPSRMTVGMMLELLAGKLGALTGRFIVHEASAWSGEFSSRNVHEVLGEQLTKLGFDYCGDETMYSGQTGQELKARIFIGCCAYQRLRHMVMDKWQCREKVGPVDVATLQPVKGRKVGGGIKVGEMERDALLSHGCVELVRDRLYSHGLTDVPVCTGCGAFLTMMRKAVPVAAEVLSEGTEAATQQQISCSQCSSKEYRMVGLPFAFLYLCVELLALNMELCLQLKPDPVPA